MIALDTNVLVRLLVNSPDDDEQINTAKSLLKNTQQVYITQIVQVETVWVLETAFGFEKHSIIMALEHLQSHSIFQLQNINSFTSALSLFKENNADFSDCLILSESLHQDYTLATFDKKLGRLSGTKLLKT